jgi:hypothetical protein
MGSIFYQRAVHSLLRRSRWSRYRPTRHGRREAQHSGIGFILLRTTVTFQRNRASFKRTASACQARRGRRFGGPATVRFREVSERYPGCRSVSSGPSRQSPSASPQPIRRVCVRRPSSRRRSRARIRRPRDPRRANPPARRGRLISGLAQHTGPPGTRVGHWAGRISDPRPAGPRLPPWPRRAEWVLRWAANSRASLSTMRTTVAAKSPPVGQRGPAESGKSLLPKA